MGERGDAAHSIADARLRTPCDVEARVVSMTLTPGRLLALDVVVDDGTGTLLCHFTGRRSIPGVVGGTRLRVAGTLVTYRSRRCLLNPAYELLDAGDVASTSS